VRIKNLLTILFLGIISSGCASIQYTPEEVPQHLGARVRREAESRSKMGCHMGALYRYCDLGDYKNAKIQLMELKKNSPDNPFIFMYENFLRGKE
jgi:hypothetical protein